MKPTRSLLPSTLIAISLSGCSIHAPSGQANQKLPEKWKQSAGFPVSSPTKDLARWWRYFEDPVLSQVIADGLSNSPDVASASARVREARARRKESASSLFPSVSGGALSNSRIEKTDGSPSVSETSYSAGLDASWEVDLFGKNRSNLQAATAQVGAADENLNSVRAALASEIAIAYTRLRANETGLVILNRIVKSREQTSQLAGWRQQSGEADSLESSQALSSLEQARAGIPALQQSITQNRNQIALLCGRDPGALDAMLSSGKSGIPDPAQRLAVGIPADTIRQRPDVRLAGYQLLAAAANTRAAEAERFPSLRLNGTLGVRPLTPGSVFTPESVSAGIIASLTGPIFNAGRISANIEAEQAIVDQAAQTYRSVVLTALSEVENSLVACRRSGERLATLEKATSAAREAAKLAEQRYQAGVIDLLTVLDSQRSLFNLEESLLTVQADRTAAYINLYKSLGGGWY
ncbi:MAG: efflux transporter outer membrane subunit [Gloeobacteraceae cyanobacterium ES-bin-144]|nr:efflux transporter outer membrane subunit [Verrucomicrobiales bacterium]